MFSIEQKQEAGFTKVILKDLSTQTIAEIIPDCGGILHSFTIVLRDQQINVIDSYLSREDFLQHAESKGFLGLKLSPFVCRLNQGSYQYEGKKYTFRDFFLGKHSIHGSIYKKPFKVLNTEANGDFARVSMQYEYRSDDPGYPFSYDCRVTWQLEGNHLLSVTTQSINRSKVPIPMQDGWHPYFRLEDPVDTLELCFQSKELLEFDEELLPTGKLLSYHQFKQFRKIGNKQFDNCFTVDSDAAGPKCILRNDARGIEINILPEKSYPYLQIYIPPHRKSIAIENISGAPDGFNNGMGVMVLDPGRSAVFKTAYQLRLL